MPIKGTSEKILTGKFSWLEGSVSKLILQVVIILLELFLISASNLYLELVAKEPLTNLSEPPESLLWYL
jgi:hypothetical protein